MGNCTDTADVPTALGSVYDRLHELINNESYRPTELRKAPLLLVKLRLFLDKTRDNYQQRLWVFLIWRLATH